MVVINEELQGKHRHLKVVKLFSLIICFHGRGLGMSAARRFQEFHRWLLYIQALKSVIFRCSGLCSLGGHPWSQDIANVLQYANKMAMGFVRFLVRSRDSLAVASPDGDSAG